MKIRYGFHQATIITLTLLGILSLFTEKKQLGSLYPAFHWKLYSQPSGTNHSVVQYRIYSKKNNEILYRRNAITESSTFNADDYVYTLNYYVEKSINDTLKPFKYRNKLYTFLKHIVPNDDHYKIVSESYEPKALMQAPMRFDTLELIQF